MSNKLKTEIKKASRYCAYCHKEFTSKKDATIDHLKPKSAGGKRKLGNIVVACECCNRKKANTPLYIWLKDVRIRANLMRYLIYMQNWNKIYSDNIYKKIEKLRLQKCQTI